MCLWYLLRSLCSSALYHFTLMLWQIQYTTCNHRVICWHLNSSLPDPWVFPEKQLFFLLKFVEDNSETFIARQTAGNSKVQVMMSQVHFCFLFRNVVLFDLSLILEIWEKCGASKKSDLVQKLWRAPDLESVPNTFLSIHKHFCFVYVVAQQFTPQICRHHCCHKTREKKL